MPITAHLHPELAEGRGWPLTPLGTLARHAVITSRRHAALGCLALLLAVTGAGAEAADLAAYRRLNVGLAEQHVIPRYEALAAATAALDEDTAAFCAAPGGAGLDGLRDRFREAQAAWMGVQHLRFGPVQFLLRYDRFAFWPDQRNTAGRHLGALLAGGDPAALEPRAFARGSVAVQGFPALERLLFGKDAAQLTEAGDAAAFRCRVLRRIAGNLAVMSRGTLDGWRTGDSAYRRVLETTGEDNAYYRDDKEASLDFFKAFHGSLQMIADLKLARPLGAEAAKAKPRRTESWRSEASLANLQANLRALEELYAGPAGFSTLVVSVAGDRDLDQALRDRLKAALAAAEAIRPPLSSALGDAEERGKVERLLAEVRALQGLATQRLAAALDLPVGFNAFDGD